MPPGESTSHRLILGKRELRGPAEGTGKALPTGQGRKLAGPRVGLGPVPLPGVQRSEKRPAAAHKGRHWRRGLGLLLICLILLAGCTRRFYREAADKEVNAILAEKDRYPQWKIEQYHVYPDPRARFADPTNPDHPPMPPDDPAAWRLSPHPQHPGHAGVAWVEGKGYLELLRRWDEENRARLRAEQQTADVQVKPYLQTEEVLINQTSADGIRPFLLNLEQAVELGVINSREFQNIREDLYLACLPVTLQRFSFTAQWLAVENAFRQWAGLESLEGPQNNWTLGSQTGFTKLFSTGALLTLNFANTTVFNFLNLGHGTTSSSVINLDLVQPLLRGGGRAVTLEPLTQAERNLLYNIRAYARFREQFYLSIALGTSLPGSLAAAANTAGALAGGPISVLATLGIASTDVSGVFRGYLPTLFRELDMAVDKKYAQDLERALKLFEGFEEGGAVSPLQVDQVRSTLLNAQNTVLKDMQDTTNALDQLKLQLGLPVNTPLILDDSPGRPITQILNLYYQVTEEADAANRRLEQQDGLTPAQFREYLRRTFAEDPLVQDTQFRQKVAAAWQDWHQLDDKALQQRQATLGTERRKLLDAKTDAEVRGQPWPAEQQQRLTEVNFQLDVGDLEATLRQYEARPWEKLTQPEQRRQMQTHLFRLTARAAEIVLVWARNERREQLRARWPLLPPAFLEGIDLAEADPETAQRLAIQVALRNRLDLMNARAQVVDAWRQLAVTANALQGVVTLHYHLDSVTPFLGSHALAFSSAATNQALILNTQLPLVRLAERNNYRLALINYQLARRNLMSLEDNIAAQVRFDVRQLQLFAANYKIQQKVLESLYSQVESALEVLIAPPEPPAAGTAAPPGAAATAAGAASAAALTQQYLSALGGLNGAQTKMYDIWLSYLATRMQLYLDLEQLTLDNRGVWTDELATRPAPRTVAGSAADSFRRPDTHEQLPPPRLLPPAETPAPQ
jgi:hypothetical protein